MKIKVSKIIGFCSGVKRAVDLTKTTLRNAAGKKVYSLGEVIHNPIVVGELKNLGLEVVSDVNTITDNSIVIFPSHGVCDNIKNLIVAKNLTIIDTTCPYVQKVHKIVKTLKDSNYQVVIFGDKDHPEINAIKSLCFNAFVVDKPIKLRDNQSLSFGIISQTTQAKDKYFNFIYQFLQLNPFVKEVRVFNTICADVIARQKEVRALSKKVDAMFIIGGKNSANTKRLKALCFEAKVAVVGLERASDLKNKQNLLKRIKTAGIATGASTPDFLVNELVDYLNSKIRKLHLKLQIK